MELGILPFVSNIVFTSAVLYYAAKIIDSKLKFNQAVIVSIASSIGAALPGGIGIILSILAYFGLLKLFTDDSIIKLIILTVISWLLTMAFTELIVIPMISSSFNMTTP